MECFTVVSEFDRDYYRWYRFICPWLCSKETIFKPLNESWHLAWQPSVVYWLHLQKVNTINSISRSNEMTKPKLYYRQYVTVPWCDIRVKIWLFIHNCRFPFPLLMNIMELPDSSTNGFVNPGPGISYRMQTIRRWQWIQLKLEQQINSELFTQTYANTKWHLFNKFVQGIFIIFDSILWFIFFGMPNSFGDHLNDYSFDWCLFFDEVLIIHFMIMFWIDKLQ